MMPSLRTSFRALLVACALAAPAALAQDIQRIVAVVNDDVISARDLDRQLDLAMVSTGLPNTLENRRRMAERVLRSLIDERLKVQEAKRRNVSATEAEVERYFAMVAQQNNVSPERFEDQLRSAGIPRESLLQAFRTEIMWGKLMRQRIIPSIVISDDEVQAAVARLKESAGQTEYLVSEIFLAMDPNEREDDVARTAGRIVEQLRGGAPFTGMARQFSQGATAASGGVIGWIQPRGLPEEVEGVLLKLDRGQISEPIRTTTGYYIIGLQDRREVLGANKDTASVTLKQIRLTFPIGDDAARERQAALARHVAASLKSCDDVEAKAKELNAPGSGSLGTLRLAELPPPIRAAVQDVPAGKASEPVVTDGAVSVLAVCEREDPEPPKLDAEQVRQNLVMRRADLMQRRYLRDLRRDAAVEIR